MDLGVAASSRGPDETFCPVIASGNTEWKGNAMSRIKQLLVVLVVFSLTLSSFGCDLLSAFSNLISPGVVFNLAQIAQTDISGPPNLLLPDWPDYDKDPTCIIPGYCGGSPFYPFSSGEGG